MRRIINKKIILLVIIVFITSLIAQMPARVGYYFISNNEIEINAIRGTIWEGAASEFSYKNLYLRDMKWNFLPKKILAGDFSFFLSMYPFNGYSEKEITFGLDGVTIKNIEGKAVTNNPTNREYFDVDITTGSYTSGTVTTVSSSSTLVISGTNTLQISVDDVASGTITMPTGTYTSNTSIANELEEAINDDSTLTSAGKSVSVLWTGSEYQIVSKTGTTDASIGITSVTTSLESHLKLTATNGGVEAWAN